MAKWFGLFRKKPAPEVKEEQPDPLKIREAEILAGEGESADRLRLLLAELESAQAVASELEQANSKVFWCALWLENVSKYLQEALSIGVWMKSDGCSDNRDKRRAISDAASDAWSAAGSLREFQELFPDQRKLAKPIEAEIQILENSIRPLIEVMTDVMGENRELDSQLYDANERSQELLAQVWELRIVPQAQFAEAKEKVAVLVERRKEFLESSLNQ